MKKSKLRNRSRARAADAVKIMQNSSSRSQAVHYLCTVLWGGLFNVVVDIKTIKRLPYSEVDNSNNSRLNIAGLR